MKFALYLILLSTISIATAQNSNRTGDLSKQKTSFSLATVNSISNRSVDQIDLSVDIPTGLYQYLGFDFKFAHGYRDGFSFQTTYALHPWWKGPLFSASIGYAMYGEETKKHTVPVDLGTLYRFSGNQIWGDHSVGISGTNITGIPTDRNALFIDRQTVTADWKADLFSENIVLSGELGANIDDSSMAYSLGLTLNPSHFQLGAHWSDMKTTISGGWRSTRADLSFDVSYDLYRFSDDRYVKVSVTKAVGRARETGYGRRLAREACLCGMSPLYRTLREQFDDEEHYSTIAIGGKIIYEYPDFFKNDYIHGYLMAMFTELEMYSAAELEMNIVVEDFAKSPAVFFVKQYQMKNYVKHGDDRIFSIYQDLDSNTFVADSIKDDNNIVMGEYLLRQHEYESALFYYEKVLEESYFYLKAQRGVLVSKALIRSSESYSISDSALISEYQSIQDEYDGIEDKLYELINIRQNSSVVDKLDEPKVDLYRC